MKGSLRERQPGNWELIVQLPRDPETGLQMVGFDVTCKVKY